MQNVTTLWGSFEVKNSRLAKMQLKQFSGVNLEENLDSFDKWADLFQKMPMFYMTFFGANEVSKQFYLLGFHLLYENESYKPYLLDCETFLLIK